MKNFGIVLIITTLVIGFMSNQNLHAQALSSKWKAGRGIHSSPKPAGLDSAVLPIVPQRFASAVLGDIDGDGDLDFISGGNRGQVYLYRNTGTPTAPHWKLDTGSVNSLDTLDIAPNQNTNETRLELADIDNDGDLDLFIGSRWAQNGLYKLDDIHFYRNTGSKTNPVFTKDTLPGLQLQQTGEFAGIKAVDIDNDGDLDLVVGGSDTCTYFLNIGTIFLPNFVRVYRGSPNGPGKPWNPFSTWSYISFLAPRPNFLDVDDDNDLDLVFQDEAGFLKYIENTGNDTAAIIGGSIALPLPGMDTIDFGAFGTVDFGDVNGDGTLDLIATHWNPGAWYWYEGIPEGVSITGVVDSNVSCNGLSDGGASFTTAGGIKPLTFLWSNGDTTTSITGLTAGMYKVTVTDSIGEKDSATIEILQPALLVGSTTVDSNTTCKNGSNGGVTAAVTGGTAPYTYAWSNAATSASITGVAAGTYSITITDKNGCTDTSSSTVTEPAGMSITIVVDSNVTCNGGSNGGASVTASGGTTPYTYAWSNAATSANISGVTAARYIVTITDNNGCSDTGSANITQPNLMVVSLTIDSTVSCNGFSDGGITASVTGGTTPYNYAWSNTATSASLTGVAAGNFFVTVTDKNGCVKTNNTTVTEPSVLMASSVVDSNVTCNSYSNGGATASATGGTTPYSYAWSNSATTASITGVAANTYTVTITDKNGCTDTTSSIITEPTLLVASSMVDSNVTCNGYSNGGATASATGGTAPYTYAWSNSATTASITGVTANTYTVTITDKNGCTDTISSIVTEPNALMASSIIDSNVTCNGLTDGGATASATGGTTPYTYAWSNAVTTAAITGAAAGKYTVTITDKNGCTDTTSANVTEPNALVASTMVDSNVTCNGYLNGGITASAIGGTAPYSYAWSNSATTAGITGIAANTYNVTITDKNGCTDTASSTVTEPTLLVASSMVDSNVTCNGLLNGGATASATGGTTPYSYAWNNAATTAGITGVAASKYIITITDKNGCTDTSSSTVTEPNVLVASSVIDSNVTCNGLLNGGATASATGGTAPYSYAWNNAATTAGITGVAASKYTVTITDKNGCTDTASSTITEPNVLVANSMVDSNVTCNGLLNGGATASATGGTTPYSYAWNNAATTAGITGVAAGKYTVTITDKNGCTDTTSSTVTEPNVLVASSVVDSNVTCNGLLNGGATASATGGTTPYSYAWSNNATTAGITGMAAGKYTVTITDKNGCTDTSSSTVTEPNVLVANSVVDSNVTCNGLSNGGVTASATGGTMPYTYRWHNSATSASLTGVTATQYNVTVTDKNGCTDTSISTVREPQVLDVTTQADAHVSCNGLSDGQASASSTGGTLPYTYKWNTNATTPQISNLMANTYSVTVTDKNGCTDTASINITQPNTLIAAIDSVHHVICKGDTNGMAFASAQGGTRPYSFNWSNGKTGASIGQLYQSSISVTVTDVNNCTSDAKDSIAYTYELPQVDLGADKSVEVDFVDLSVSDTFRTYLWSNGDTLHQTQIKTNGPAWVLVTDSNGCKTSDTVQVSVWLTQVKETLSDASIQVYPNPNQGVFQLKLNGFGPKVQMRILNTNGQVIEQNAWSVETAHSQSFDLRHYPKGAYFIRVHDAEQTATFRLVFH